MSPTGWFIQAEIRLCWPPTVPCSWDPLPRSPALSFLTNTCRYVQTCRCVLADGFAATQTQLFGRHHLITVVKQQRFPWTTHWSICTFDFILIFFLQYNTEQRQREMEAEKQDELQQLIRKSKNEQSECSRGQD